MNVLEHDPFPEGELVPLTNEAIEAAAVRVAICAPVEARRLVPERDLTNRTLIAIARRALDAHSRGQAWQLGTLFQLEGIDWREAVEVFIWHELDERRLVNPEAVAEARRLASWRALREHLLRAAAACEAQDMAGVLVGIDAASALTTRARSKSGMAA